MHPQCGEQEERTEPGQEQRPELSYAEGDDGVEENHGCSRGPQHTPAGPHSIGGEDPGSVLRTRTQGERHRGRGGKERGKVELGGIVIEDPACKGEADAYRPQAAQS